jgi:hypothetical protein
MTLETLTEKHNDLVRHVAERDRHQTHDLHDLRQQIADLHDRLDQIEPRLTAIEANHT